MPKIKITNPKISSELIKELQDEPLYQNEKAYRATHQFLCKILYFCRDKEFAPIPAKKIKEWFESNDIDYKKCLEVLEAHGLIEINKHYIVGTRSREYKLTDKGAELMYGGQMHYLKKIFADKKLQRQLQKQQSYHRNKDKQTKKTFLQYINNSLVEYTYSEDAVKCIEESDWSLLTRLKATMSLTDFAERDFVDQKHNQTDTRCWNEFVGMKSEMRRYFSFGDLHYRYVMDIRSCHPMFLAHYLVHRAKESGWKRHHPLLPGTHRKTIVQNDAAKERERSESLSYANSTTTNHSPTFSTISSNPISTPASTSSKPHYDGGNSDILAELERWNLMFSDPTTDPKAILIQDLNYTREQAKAALNQTINGSRQYRKFIKWFEKHYPLLFAVWNRTDKATVGIDISTFYETVLMQDFSLYELAMHLGLHLTYEFDGCGVMCSDNDTEVLVKIQQLIAHIQAISVKKWGIRPVIVVKTATGETVDPPHPNPNDPTEAMEEAPSPSRLEPQPMP